MTLLAVPKHIIRRSVEELSEMMAGKRFVGQDAPIPPMLGKSISHHFSPRTLSDLLSLSKVQTRVILKAFWETLNQKAPVEATHVATIDNSALSSTSVADNILKALAETQNMQPQTSSSPQAQGVAPAADSEFDNIPISQALVEYHQFKSTLEEMIVYVQGLRDDLAERIQSKQDENKGAKMVALGYESDIKNPKALHKAKIANFENYIKSAQHLISQLQSSDLTTTHVLDFLDLIYEYGEINQELNRKINSPTGEGLFINFVNKSKKQVQDFLEKVITAHQSPSP